jgi:hypothetical protein
MPTWLVLLLLVVGYFLATQWLLPRLGVST